MYLCVYVFIRLHITSQSGPVTLLVILCHSHWSSQGGINATQFACVRVRGRVCIICDKGIRFTRTLLNWFEDARERGLNFF